MLNAVLEETMFWENGAGDYATCHSIYSSIFRNIKCLLSYHYSLYLNYTHLTLILKSTLKRG